jgi:hypothetical protein
VEVVNLAETIRDWFASILGAALSNILGQNAVGTPETKHSSDAPPSQDQGTMAQARKCRAHVEPNDPKWIDAGLLLELRTLL